MNILFCPSDNDKASGAFRSMAKLASLLQNNFGCKILVLIPRDGNGIELLDNDGIPWLQLRTFNWTIPMKSKHKVSTKLIMMMKMTYNRFTIRKIEHIISSYSIDIVHLNTSWTYVAAIAALRKNVKVIWHIREFLEEDQKRCFFSFNYAVNLMKQSNGVVAISDSIKEKYAPYFNTNQLVRIYNGIDTECFYHESRKIMADESFNFLIVGRVCQEKGQIDLLRACAKLLDDSSVQFHIDIVGTYTDDYINILKKEVDNFGMEQIVSFQGYCDNTTQYYKKSDIVFVCSKAEAFGRVTVEAMLSGALVIGSDTAGTKELIKDELTGYLYRYGDSLDLYRAIKKAIGDTKKSSRIAKEGQRYMKENMSAGKNASDIFKLYESVF